MKKMLAINKFLLVGLLILGFSCTELEYDQELNATHPISGDWTITVKEGTHTYGPYFMKIYNTANSKDSVWIDDNKDFWEMKAKAKVDINNLTFSAENSQNKYYNSKMSFKNGKLIGKDSIYFETEFSDDAGTIYTFAGHRKVSYEEYNGL